MPLSELPTELLQAISENLRNQADVSALSRTNWRLFYALIPQLYRLNHDRGHDRPYHIVRRYKSAVKWAIEQNRLQTIRRAVAVGVDLVKLRYITLAVRLGHCEIFQALWACKLEHGGFENLNRDEDGWSPIIFAVESGKVEIAKTLLETGRVDLEVVNPPYQTPLCIACHNGNHQMAKLLLDYGANVMCQNQHQRAPLTIAASPQKSNNTSTQIIQRHKRNRDSYLETIRVLLQHGAQLEHEDVDGKTALHTAALEGHCDVVELLASRGAQIDTRDRVGNTPLISTSLNLGRLDMTQLLFRLGADPNARNYRGNTPLSMTRDTEEPVGVTTFLLQSGAKMTPDGDGNTPLHRSGYIGSLELAKLLLHHGAEINARNAQNQTPLHCIAEDRHNSEIVQLLVDQGASLTAVASGGETPLGSAIPYQLPDLIQFLIERGSNINAVTKTGEPVLQHTIRTQSLELTELLLQHGADLGTFNVNGQGALHFASMIGNVKLMEIFLHQGMPIDSRDSQGRTPLMCAIEGATSVNVKILLERGASVNETDNLNQTALHKASKHGMVKAARVFLENGADVNAKDNDNQTPLHIAKNSRRPKMVETLLENGAQCSIVGCCEDRTALDIAKISPVDIWVHGTSR